jgi:hypothetical protein
MTAVQHVLIDMGIFTIGMSLGLAAITMTALSL